MGRSRDHGGGGGGGGSPRAASSSSSSDFEFTVSLSPSSKRLSSQLCPADELFYKGQLLPLQLSPRISMVRTLLLSSSSSSASSSSDTATSSSRDSNGSTSSSFSADLLLLPTDSDSSRPSSVTEEEYSKLSSSSSPFPSTAKRPKYYFSSFATRFSSVFLHRGGSKKDSSVPLDLDAKKPNSAKEVIKKCVKKVKPFYDKLKQSNIQSSPPPLPVNNNNNHNTTTKKTFSFSIRKEKLTPTSATTTKKHDDDDDGGVLRHRRGVYIHSNSFSGNLKFPRNKMAAASCPSSMRSSPSHSGLLCIGGGGGSGGFPDLLPPVASSPPSASSVEELHSAIQGAIAHCKSSMIQGSHKRSPPPAGNGDEEVHAP